MSPPDFAWRNAAGVGAARQERLRCLSFASTGAVFLADFVATGEAAAVSLSEMMSGHGNALEVTIALVISSGTSWSG
jgi:hypothetical protein